LSGTKRVRMTRSEIQAQTRERLLLSAHQVFARSGYGGTSVDAIAAEAGYSKGAFYSNFATKEAIVLELLERYGNEEMETFRRIMALAPADARKALARWLDEIHPDEDWALLEIELALHARRNPEFAKRFYAIEQRLTEFHAQWIEDLFAQRGRKPPIDPVDLSLALRTLSCGVYLKLPPTPPHTRNAASKIIQTLLDVLAPIDAPPAPSPTMQAERSS